MDGFSVADVIQRVTKYLLEGLAVAVAMVLVMKKKSPDYEEVLSVAVVAAVVFGILDTLAPSVGGSARAGAVFGLGANMVGFPRMG
jgi:preprotein translocase subunit Sss1